MDNIFLEVLELDKNTKAFSPFSVFCLGVATDSSILMRPYLTLAYIYLCTKSVPKMTLQLTELYENESENSSESLISGCIFGKEVYAVLF